MKLINSRWLVVAMLLLTSGHFKSLFADAKEETQLKNAQVEIDKHAAVWSDDHHAKTLGEYFKVPASAICKLSASNQGWGAITIELAMAGELTIIHSEQFPLMTTSLNRIEELRASGTGWGDIARKLDFGLGSVVEETRDSATELREDDHASARRHVEHAKVEENRRIIKEEHQIAADNRADQ